MTGFPGTCWCHRYWGPSLISQIPWVSTPMGAQATIRIPNSAYIVAQTDNHTKVSKFTITLLPPHWHKNSTLPWKGHMNLDNLQLSSYMRFWPKKTPKILILIYHTLRVCCQLLGKSNSVPHMWPIITYGRDLQQPTHLENFSLHWWQPKRKGPLSRMVMLHQVVNTFWMYNPLTISISHNK